MENNFILYGIEPLIAARMDIDGLSGACEFEREAAKAARELVPSSPREVLELFHSVHGMAERYGYKSRTGLGWMDIVEAAREIVEKTFLELSKKVACEKYYDYWDN